MNPRRRLVASLAVALFVLIGAPCAMSAFDFEEHTFDSNGVSIRYLVMGEGEPVVLVHGFTANAEQNWVLPGIAPALAKEFKVIALDNRGHGKSGKPHEPAAYGMNMVHDVVRLLDHLGIKKAHVVGYSMGGFMTMDLIAHHHDRLLSAVVGGAGWSVGGDPAQGMNELAESLESGHGVAPLVRALNPIGQPPPNEQQIAMWNQMILANNDPLALAAVIRGLQTLAPATEQELRDNTVPVLAVVGSLDPLRAGVDAMNGVMAKLTIHVIEGADHMTALMNAGYAVEMTSAIRDHLVSVCGCAGTSSSE